MKNVIIKKSDLNVMIENSIKEHGGVIKESKVEETIVENTEVKPILTEGVQKEVNKFNKLINYTY